MIEPDSYRNNIRNCKLANSRHILVFVKAHFIYFIKPCAALFTVTGLGGGGGGGGVLTMVGED